MMLSLSDGRGLGQREKRGELQEEGVLSACPCYNGFNRMYSVLHELVWWVAACVLHNFLDIFFGFYVLCLSLHVLCFTWLQAKFHHNYN